MPLLLLLFLLLLPLALTACDDDSVNDHDAAAPRTDGASPTDFDAQPPSFDAGSERLCNGAGALCVRRYDELVHFGTHHSAAFGSPPWIAPTQGRSLGDQLRSGGVRVLELEVHAFGGALAICNGSCEHGSAGLGAALAELATFLEQNPTELLTLIVQSYAVSGELAAAFEQAGLAALCHTQALDATWPTLEALLADGRRVVVFVRENGGARDDDAGAREDDAGVESESRPSWMHDARAWLRETVPSIGAECALVDADASAPLLVLRHYPPDDEGAAAVPAADLAAAHDAHYVADRITRCSQDHGLRPTFVLTTFAELGDPNGGVQIANGLR